MVEYKLILGYLALAIEAVAYAFYFVGIYKGKTKPHAFTWLVWAILNMTGFAAIIFSGGGAGAWVFAGNAFANFLIAGIGFYQQHVQYDVYDWLALGGGIFGIFLWWLTSNPFFAVLFVSISDTIAIIPTLRKAYRVPEEENFASFFIGLFYYLVSIPALSVFSISTLLYPLTIIASDTAVILLIYFRKKKI